MKIGNYMAGIVPNKSRPGTTGYFHNIRGEDITFFAKCVNIDNGGCDTFEDADACNFGRICRTDDVGIS